MSTKDKEEQVHKTGRVTGSITKQISFTIVGMVTFTVEIGRAHV